MALSDQLILETRQAFRELDALQGRLDRLSDVRLDVNLDTSNLNADIERSQQLARETAGAFGEVREQVVLTTSEYRQAVQLVEQGENAARAVAIATGDVAQEASTVEDAFRRVTANLNLSEDEARDLANSVGRATAETSELDADLRQVARSMGLSEQEAAQFSAEMRRASSEADVLDARTNNLAAGWRNIRGLIVGAVAAFGVRGLVRQFDQAIESTLALSESVNAVNVIFEEGADTVLNFAQTAADAAGLATSEAQQLVVPIGALLRNFGFDAQAAGDAAVTLTQRAADLASVFNTDVSEALGAIQAALRGEADPLERFGASISAARVEAFALSEGLAASKAELTDSIRLQARYALILSDTAAAAGDFANTSDEAANRQRILAAGVENARAALGEELLPAYEALLEATPAFLDALRGLVPVLEDFAAVIADIDFTAAISGLRRFGTTASGVIQLIQGDLAGATAAGFINDFNQTVEAGVDPARAFVNVLSQLEGFRLDVAQGLDADEVARVVAELQNAADLDFEDLRQLRINFEQFGGDLGLTEDELAGVIEGLREAEREALSLVRGGIDPADRKFLGFTDTVEDLGDAAEETGGQLDPLGDALEGVARISGDTGLGISEVVRNIALLDPALAPVVASLGAGVVEAAAFNRAFGELATAVSLDFGDAVDEFELLLEVTNEAGDTVPATVEQILTDLQTQAERFARLELATTILEALGFDDLAAELRSRGPDAADAAEDFVDDIRSAMEAESLLEDGGVLGDEAIQGLRDALREGNITPELLELASQFTSDQVRNEILRAAAVAGADFITEMQRIIASLPLQLRLTPEIIALAPQVGPAGPGATGFGAGSGVGGGGVSTQGTVVNQTNNFNTTPVPTTDTQRITQATSDILRHVN